MPAGPPLGAASARAERARSSAPRREPSRPAVARPAPSLRLLTAEDLLERTRRRRARAVGLLAVALVVGALLAIAAAQALVASRQVRLDGLQQELASAVSANENLQLAHAELSSPERVLHAAERNLGMVVPRSVTYLSAVDPPPAGVAAPSGSTLHAVTGTPAARRPGTTPRRGAHRAVPGHGPSATTRAPASARL